MCQSAKAMIAYEREREACTHCVAIWMTTLCTLTLSCTALSRLLIYTLVWQSIDTTAGCRHAIGHFFVDHWRSGHVVVETSRNKLFLLYSFWRVCLAVTQFSPSALLTVCAKLNKNQYNAWSSHFEQSLRYVTFSVVETWILFIFITKPDQTRRLLYLKL